MRIKNRRDSREIFVERAREMDERVNSPIRWSRFGAASLLLAKTVKSRRPATLILSLPRSGSSWVGEILGSAANALYLREPITQTLIASGESNLAIMDIVRLIIAKSSGEEVERPYSTARDSKSMIWHWRDKISSYELKEIKEAYFKFSSPWYRSSCDWWRHTYKHNATKE